MHAKSALQPLLFFFECPKDGMYPVRKETLLKFITVKLRKKLTRELKEGAAGAKLKFEGGCPTCEPNTTHKVELVALTPRRN